MVGDAAHEAKVETDMQGSSDDQFEDASDEDDTLYGVNSNNYRIRSKQDDVDPHHDDIASKPSSGEKVRPWKHGLNYFWNTLKSGIHSSSETPSRQDHQHHDDKMAVEHRLESSNKGTVASAEDAKSGVWEDPAEQMLPEHDEEEGDTAWEELSPKHDGRANNIQDATISVMEPFSPEIVNQEMKSEESEESSPQPANKVDVAEVSPKVLEDFLSARSSSPLNEEQEPSESGIQSPPVPNTVRAVFGDSPLEALEPPPTGSQSPQVEVAPFESSSTVNPDQPGQRSERTLPQQSHDSAAAGSPSSQPLEGVSPANSQSRIADVHMQDKEKSSPLDTQTPGDGQEVNSHAVPSESGPSLQQSTPNAGRGSPIKESDDTPSNATEQSAPLMGALAMDVGEDSPKKLNGSSEATQSFQPPVAPVPMEVENGDITVGKAKAMQFEDADDEDGTNVISRTMEAQADGVVDFVQPPPVKGSDKPVGFAPPLLVEGSDKLQPDVVGFAPPPLVEGSSKQQPDVVGFAPPPLVKGSDKPRENITTAAGPVAQSASIFAPQPEGKPTVLPETPRNSSRGRHTPLDYLTTMRFHKRRIRKPVPWHPFPFYNERIGLMQQDNRVVAKVPAGATSIVHIMGRRINLAQHDGDSMNPNFYALAQDWVDDSPRSKRGQKRSHGGASLYPHRPCPPVVEIEEGVAEHVVGVSVASEGGAASKSELDEKEDETKSEANGRLPKIQRVDDERTGDRVTKESANGTVEPNDLLQNLIARGKQLRRVTRLRYAAEEEAARKSLLQKGVVLPPRKG